MLILTALVFAILNEEAFTHSVPVEQPISLYAQQLTGEALVNYVNEQQSLFTATYSPESEDYVTARLMDPEFLDYPRERELLQDVKVDVELPESFDAREKWPDCPSISYIRGQSACGSCWAVATASVISDRACIESNGTIKGVCKPYAFHPCGRRPNQTYYGECPGSWPTPKCEKSCQKGYPKSYEEDKIPGKRPYILPRNEAAIRKDIMMNGPVVSSMHVYTDFSYYSGGIYKHTAGAFRGGHAIKILGWGTENGTDYWIVANSWNTNWGEDNGMYGFRNE
ncbi:papain family cysteine protease [Ancylostoma ceylanicum]|uniref:Papain family cysteine protease n=1 Tax=Ancylostoma ceylanicum TaxID=53326 RepID=A0A0D6LHN9_9BILA|nr:papain family cysteine protease [Ancylostoma ceylanicum]